MTIDQAAGEGTAGSRVEALRRFVARVAPAGHDIRVELEDSAAEVLAAFEHADIDALLLKGAALASLLYVKPGEERYYSDLDLLVAPHRLDAAEQSLAALGYSNTHAVYGVDDVGSVVHGEAWVRAARGSTEPVMIDLHRWLPGSEAARSVAWEALWRRRVSIDLGGRQVAVLDRVGQAVHLATHCAQHGEAFEKHLRELDLALERWPTEIWEAAARLAREVGATEAFAAGLRLTASGAYAATQLGLPETPELEWTIRHRELRPRGTFHIRALARTGDLRELLRIVRRSLFPSRAWIVHENPWARAGGLLLLGAYGLHVLRSPLWAARAWWFLHSARRAAYPRRHD